MKKKLGIKTSVIILNWNRKKGVLTLLKKLQSQTYNHFNIFNLVTGRAFSKNPRFPEIHVREYNWLSFPGLIKRHFTIGNRVQAGNSGWLEMLHKATRLCRLEIL